MNFLVDAHLPRALCTLLNQHGDDAVHTRDLAGGNATRDRVINDLSVAELRIVISKDSDFFYSHLLCGRPWKLLLVKTGNTSAQHLCDIVERNLPAITSALQTNTLVVIDRVKVTTIK